LNKGAACLPAAQKLFRGTNTVGLYGDSSRNLRHVPFGALVHDDGAEWGVCGGMATYIKCLIASGHFCFSSV
jgi:hypothetical protein